LDTSHMTVLDVSKYDLIRDRFRIIRRKSLQVGVNPKTTGKQIPLKFMKMAMKGVATQGGVLLTP